MTISSYSLKGTLRYKGRIYNGSNATLNRLPGSSFENHGIFSVDDLWFHSSKSNIRNVAEDLMTLLPLPLQRLEHQGAETQDQFLACLKKTSGRILHGDSQKN